MQAYIEVDNFNRIVGVKDLKETTPGAGIEVSVYNTSFMGQYYIGGQIVQCFTLTTDKPKILSNGTDQSNVQVTNILDNSPVFFSVNDGVETQINPVGGIASFPIVSTAPGAELTVKARSASYGENTITIEVI